MVFLVSGGVNVSIKNNTLSGMGRAIQCIAWKNSGPGSVYPITYNNLTDQNKEDLKTNIGKKLGLSGILYELTRYIMYLQMRKQLR